MGARGAPTEEAEEGFWVWEVPKPKVRLLQQPGGSLVGVEDFRWSEMDEAEEVEGGSLGFLCFTLGGRAGGEGAEHDVGDALGLHGRRIR